VKDVLGESLLGAWFPEVKVGSNARSSEETLRKDSQENAPDRLSLELMLLNRAELAVLGRSGGDVAVEGREVSSAWAS